jgi:hypothetical protein
MSRIISYAPLDVPTLNSGLLSFEMNSLNFIKWNEDDPIPHSTGSTRYDGLDLLLFN